MDPVSIGTMAMAGSAGGSILGAVGALFEGGAKSAQYKYQSGVAKMNANIARQNADYAIRAGENQALQSGRKTAFTVGKQITGKAAGNIDVNSGNVAQVTESQRLVGAEDRAIIRENAGRKAYGQLTEAATQDANAKMYQKAASTAKTASYISAASSILGGISSVSSKWMQASQLGMGMGGHPTILGDPAYYEEPAYGP